MKASVNGRDVDPADARTVRRASRSVGLQIAVASSVLALVVLALAFVYVFTQIAPATVLDFRRRTPATIDIGGVDILIAGIVLGVVAVALAGLMSWFATRRAVRPLARALKMQRAFVADASHELRTPLAVLDARLQLAERNLADDEGFAPTIAELRRDTKTLIEIVNDLLAAAESDEADTRGNAAIEINPVVTLAIDSMRLVAADRDVAIVFGGRETLATLMPAGSIHRCMIAILDNALRYSPPGGTITVSLDSARSFVRLRVRDQGPGILGIEPARIFDRFARADAAAGSNGSRAPGFGIGLALVRDAVARYGGTASVAATSAAGTTIELLIPRARLR
jgi:two-component system OmpR family sensor kinase